MSTPEANFRAIAPAFMARLREDFPTLNKEDAAAVFGNAGHESLGFTKLQEIAPVGGRGGYGWFQWTGPRRRAYEAFAKAKKLDVADPEANYGFLVEELRGDEKKAIPALRAAVDLEAKVKAFEAAYERAGVKHYPERIRWARIALDAESAGGVSPSPAPEVPASPEPTGSLWAAILSLILNLFRSFRK